MSNPARDQAVLLERAAIRRACHERRDEIVGLLRPDHFTLTAHQDAWKLATANGKPNTAAMAMELAGKHGMDVALLVAMADPEADVIELSAPTDWLVGRILAGYRARTADAVAVRLQGGMISPETAIAELQAVQLERPIAAPHARMSEALVPAGQIRAKSFSPRPSLLGDGVLSAGGFGIIFGQPGTYKSWLGMSLLRSSARGDPFMRLPTLAGGTRCGLVQLELDEDLIQPRLEALGIGDHELDDNFGLVCRPALQGPVDLMAGDFAAVRHMIDSQALRLVVLDAFSRFHVLDENDNREMGVLLAGVDNLRQSTGCAIVLIHHPRKGTAGKDDDDMDALRGSSRMQSDTTLIVRVTKSVGKLNKITFAKVSAGPTPDPIYFHMTDHGPEACDAPGEASTKKGQANREKVEDAIRNAPGGRISVQGMATMLGMSRETVRSHANPLASVGMASVSFVGPTAFFSSGAGPADLPSDLFDASAGGVDA